MIWIILIMISMLVLALAIGIELASGQLRPAHLWLLVPVGLILEIIYLLGE